MPTRSVSRPVHAARMADVAQAAGVSIVTVSRALNEPDKLAPATLAAVRGAIQQVRYVHNLTAGSLASRRTRIVAAIVPTVASSIFSDTIDALATVMTRHRYQLLLGQTQYSEQEEARLVDAFLGRRVDGLVLTGTAHARGLRSRLQRVGIPVVETWDLAPRPIHMLVGFSNRAAGVAAAQYLTARWRGPLAFIGGADDRSAARLEGFRAAALATGAGEVATAVVASPSSVAEAGAALAGVLAQAPGTAAVFCTNDMLAAGVLFECQRRRIAVPQQLAVMGFADLPIAASIEPALTTVRVHSAAMGQRAGELLMDWLGDVPGEQRMVDLGFEVIARASA